MRLAAGRPPACLQAWRSQLPRAVPAVPGAVARQQGRCRAARADDPAAVEPVPATGDGAAAPGGNSYPAPAQQQAAKQEYIVFTAEQLTAPETPALAAAAPGQADRAAAAAPAQQAAAAAEQAAQSLPSPVAQLVLAVGPADEATDEAAQLETEVQQVPPPLIDPTVDIANDPQFAIRIMDILDQVALAGDASRLAASAQAAAIAAAPAAPVQPPQQQPDPSQNGADPQQPQQAQQQQQQPQQQQPQQQQHQQQPEQPAEQGLSFVRQPAAFCTNCCTPLDPLRPAAACSACGHLPANDSLLFSQGVSSPADLASHSPTWLLLQQQQQQQQGRKAAEPSWRSKGAQQPDAAAQQAAARAEAGKALRHARQLLHDAGMLQLPTTLLAWEDPDAEPEPAMHLHRGLLPPNHERPERLRAILARLRTAGLLDCCERLAPREATEEELAAVHSAGLVGAVAAISNANQPSDLNSVAAHMAPDSLGNRFTNRAARLAAGTAAELAQRLVSGTADNGLALVRPVGHSAGIDSTEAGSFLNSAAVAVRAAQRAGARRVMVVDWDVHHCKGTSEVFAEDPNVLVFSLHRFGNGFFPTTGGADESGQGRGRGRTINVAWAPPVVLDKRGRRVQVEAPPVSDGDYLTAWAVLLLPVAAEFRPDLILVSAGFDAADKDPLGHYRVHPECFGHLTALLRPLAPLGLLLEGGYNLAATAACVEASLRALLGERPAPMRGTRYAGVTGWSSIIRTLLVQQEHWQSLGLLNFLQLATPPPLEGEEEEWEAPDEEGEEDESEEEGEEGELVAAELEAALAAAAGEGGAAPRAPGADPLAPRQVLSALQAEPDLMQQVLDMLDAKIAAQAAAAAGAAGQSGADAPRISGSSSGGSSSGGSSSGGTPAAKAGPAGWGRPGQGSEVPPGGEPALPSWSAGGFLEALDALDPGSDDEADGPLAAAACSGPDQLGGRAEPQVAEAQAAAVAGQGEAAAAGGAASSTQGDAAAAPADAAEAAAAEAAALEAQAAAAAQEAALAAAEAAAAEAEAVRATASADAAAEAAAAAGAQAETGAAAAAGEGAQK